MTSLGAVLTTVAPSVGLGVIFYFAMRWVLRADRNERRHLSELDRELDAAQARHSSPPAEEIPAAPEVN